MEDRILKFVARYYKAGRLDIDRAFARFVNNAGIQMPGGGVPRLAGRRRTLFAMMPVAAALALFVTGMVLMRPGWEEYRAIDVAQKFTLPDSTEVVLAPGTELKFRIKRNAREARMSSGKVYFNVHRDESSPFSINAGNGYVRVLGTEFQVILDEASVRVDVAGGKVLFRQHDNTDASSLILTAGMSAILNAESTMPEQVEQKSRNFAAWASQEFVFENTPLEDVVAELSEYYGKEITVKSAGEWKTKCLTASFAADDLQIILSLISSAFDVEMDIIP